MRKHLAQDFTYISHVDLHGNMRKNPKLSGTTHNVFGIQVGVGITVAIKGKKDRGIQYYRVPEFWKRQEKLMFLRARDITWQVIKPSANSWLSSELDGVWLGSVSIESVFSVYCRGLETTRDAWIYGFNRESLFRKVNAFTSFYNSEMDRWYRASSPKDLDKFLNKDDHLIKWSSSLKEDLVVV